MGYSPMQAVPSTVAHLLWYVSTSQSVCLLLLSLHCFVPDFLFIFVYQVANPIRMDSYSMTPFILVTVVETRTQTSGPAGQRASILHHILLRHEQFVCQAFSLPTYPVLLC